MGIFGEPWFMVLMGVILVSLIVLLLYLRRQRQDED
jgi:LPXTG-motif cell wall-anchored protein